MPTIANKQQHASEVGFLSDLKIPDSEHIYDDYAQDMLFSPWRRSTVFHAALVKYAPLEASSSEP